jgi:hypothetical protein
MALARSPHALRRLLSLGTPAEGQLAQPAQHLDDSGHKIAELGRLELISVASGPLNYFRQRVAGEGVIS